MSPIVRQGRGSRLVAESSFRTQTLSACRHDSSTADSRITLTASGVIPALNVSLLEVVASGSCRRLGRRRLTLFPACRRSADLRGVVSPPLSETLEHDLMGKMVPTATRSTHTALLRSHVPLLGYMPRRGPLCSQPLRCPRRRPTRRAYTHIDLSTTPALPPRTSRGEHHARSSASQSSPWLSGCPLLSKQRGGPPRRAPPVRSR
jgi:hypothetical protein